MTVDDLHLEADLFFGPCNDPPDCPGSRVAADRPAVDIHWPLRNHLRLVGDDPPSLDLDADDQGAARLPVEEARPQLRTRSPSGTRKR